MTDRLRIRIPRRLDCDGFDYFWGRTIVEGFNFWKLVFVINIADIGLILKKINTETRLKVS